VYIVAPLRHATSTRQESQFQGRCLKVGCERLDDSHFSKTIFAASKALKSVDVRQTAEIATAMLWRPVAEDVVLAS
jgi:hypothetical protein